MIERASLARTASGKHLHQWRVRNALLRRFCRHVLRAAVHHARTFDELHARVEDAAQRVAGIGELAIYDTAHRIGAYLGLDPKRVYLHRGTRKGAAALGLGRGRKTVEVWGLPRPFCRLRPYEIEECLCICERDLRACVRR